MKTKTNEYIEKKLAKAGKLAGTGFAIMFVFGFLADSVIMPRIINWQDPMHTSNNIYNQSSLFIAGILSYAGDMIANVFIAFVLYVLLKPVNKYVSIIAAGFRLLYVIIRSSVLCNLVKILDITKAGGKASVEISNKLMELLKADSAGYTYALIFFGIHVLLIGYLIFRSGYIPRILGILLMIAFTGYQVYCFAFILDTNFELHKNIYTMILAIPGVISEFSLCIWLLFKRIRFKEKTNRGRTRLTVLTSGN